MINELIESAKLAAIIVAFPAALAVIALVFDRRAERRHRHSLAGREFHRPDYWLLGDDWRDCVTDFFTESFIRRTRRRFAIAATCGADPENREGRTAATADPHTTHGGVGAHESLRGQ